MSSPLSWFRKKQKLLLGVFGVLLMFAFTISLGSGVDPIVNYLSGGTYQSGSEGQEIVVTWKGGRLTETDLQIMRYSRNQLLRFLELVSLYASERGATPRSSAVPRTDAEESLLETLLLANQAEKMGLVVSDQAVLDHLGQFTGDQVSPGEMASLLKQATGGRMTQDQMFAALRQELLAQRMRGMAGSGVTPASPVSSWDFFNRLERRVSAEVSPIEVARFIADVQEPDETELSEFYEQFKDRYAYPNSPEPGFKQRQKLAFQFVRANYDDFLQEELSSVTDEEVKEYYAQHKDSFREVDLPGADGDDAGSSGLPGSSQTLDGPGPGDLDLISPQGDRVDEDTVETEQPDPEDSGATESRIDSSASEPDSTSSGQSATDSSSGTDIVPEDGPESSSGPNLDDSPSEPAGTEEEPDASGSDSASSNHAASSPGVKLAMNRLLLEDDEADDSDGNEASDEGETDDEAPNTDSAQESGDEEPIDEEVDASTAQESGDDDTAPGAVIANTSADDLELDVPATADISSGKQEDAGESDTVVTPSNAGDGSGREPDNAVATPENDLNPSDGESPSADAGTEGGVETPTYKPLEEVSDEIRREIARPRAQDKLNASVSKVNSEIEAYYRSYVGWQIDSSEDPAAPQPPVPDFSQIAAQHGLTAGSTPLVDQIEVGEYEIGESYALSFAQNQIARITFADVAFREDAPLYRARLFPDSDVEVKFLFWKTDEKESYVPEMQDIRSQVVRAWKMREALTLAKKAADAEAKRVAASGKSLAEVLSSDPDRTFVDTGEVSWMTSGSVALGGGGAPFVSSIPGVEGAGREFMEAMFRLDVGEVGVGVNQPHNVVYVIQVKSETPAQDSLRERFFDGGVTVPLFYISIGETQRILSDWYVHLREQLNVEWTREPLEPSSS